MMDKHLAQRERERGILNDNINWTARREWMQRSAKDDPGETFTTTKPLNIMSIIDGKPDPDTMERLTRELFNGSEDPGADLWGAEFNGTRRFEEGPLGTHVKT